MDRIDSRWKVITKHDIDSVIFSRTEKQKMDSYLRAALNLQLVSRLSPLDHMYRQAAERDEQETQARRKKDWADWMALDDESKRFVLGYLGE